MRLSTIRVEGSLDFGGSIWLMREIDTLLEAGRARQVRLDLGQVEGIDQYGVSTLLLALTRLEQENRSLEITAISDRGRRVLEQYASSLPLPDARGRQRTQGALSRSYLKGFEPRRGRRAS